MSSNRSEDRLADLRRQLARAKTAVPSSSAPIKAGDRLVFAYASQMLLEWLVIAEKATSIVVVPLDDAAADHVDERPPEGWPIVIRFGPFDTRTAVPAPAVVEVPHSALQNAQRLDAIGRFDLEKVQHYVGMAGPTQAKTPWHVEAERLQSTWPSNVAAHSEPRNPVSRQNGVPVQRWPSFRHHWQAGFAAMAGAIFAVSLIGIVNLEGPYERARPNAYKYRKVPGEAGIELRLGDDECLPKGAGKPKACPVAGHSVFTMVYRLDRGVPLNRIKVIRIDRAGRPKTLELGERNLLTPTTNADGTERCRDGFCVVAELETLAPGESLKVVLERSDDLVSTPWYTPSRTFNFSFE